MIWEKLLAHLRETLGKKDRPKAVSIGRRALVHPGVAFPYFFRFGHLFLAHCAFIHIAFRHVVALGCGACRCWALRVR